MLKRIFAPLLLALLPAALLYFLGRPLWAGAWLGAVLVGAAFLQARGQGLARVALLLSLLTLLAFSGLSLDEEGRIGIDLVGLGIGLGLFVAIAASLLFLASDLMLVQRGSQWQPSFAYLLNSLLGLGGEFLIVQEGHVEATRPKGLLGGPSPTNAVYIETDQVVVFECMGKFTRTAGPGFVYTQPLERIRRVIITRSRFQKIMLEDGVTKDGIPVVINFALMSRIAPESGKEIRPGEYYPYSEEAVLKATYNTFDWEIAIREVAKNLLRDKIAQCYLDDIYDPAHPGSFPLGEIKVQLKQQLAKIADEWGIIVTSFQISRVEVPKPIRQQIMARWEADLERKEQLARAKAEREAMSVKAKTENMMAKIVMIKAKTEAKKLELTEKARAHAKAEIVDKILQIIEQHTGQKDPELALAYLQVLMMAGGVAGYPPSLRPYLRSEGALNQRLLLEIARVMPKLEAPGAEGPGEDNEARSEQENKANRISAHRKA